VSLLSGAIVIWMSRSMAAQLVQMPEALPPGTEVQSPAAIQEAVTQGVLEMMIEDPQQAAFLGAIPLLVLFFFWANRTFLPWLAALIGFDSVGREIEAGTVRYYTLRTRRSSLVLGRYLSNAALIVLLTALTHLLIFGFGAVFIEGFARMSAAGHLTRLWLLVVPVALAWLAFMLCLSTLLRPYQALLVGVAAILGTAMAGWITRFSETLAPLRWVLPGEYGGLLLSHRMSDQLVGAGVFLGVAMVFVSLAVATLERRDV
jgi:ABC-2 type transport system permease protein